VATLTDEQRDLLALEINTLHESWLVHLKDELVSREFLQLKRFLKAEVERGATVFPPSADVYAWSRLTPLHTVKVVILGQDPYHGVNQAHGLCFSVRPPTPAPPSLKNMYRALERDYPAFKPPPRNGGLLTPWARRGVLLLNSALTVRAHEANSHAGKGWERFTRRVVELVDRSRRSGVVFLAWGAHAQERCAKVGARHLVLKSVHPSPLSAHRGFVSLFLLPFSADRWSWTAGTLRRPTNGSRRAMAKMARSTGAWMPRRSPSRGFARSYGVSTYLLRMMRNRKAEGWSKRIEASNMVEFANRCAKTGLNV
jgi:uracil-DNA glycosylase